MVVWRVQAKDIISWARAKKLDTRIATDNE